MRAYALELRKSFQKCNNNRMATLPCRQPSGSSSGMLGSTIAGVAAVAVALAGAAWCTRQARC